jgi:hypothetical protein
VYWPFLPAASQFVAAGASERQVGCAGAAADARADRQRRARVLRPASAVCVMNFGLQDAPCGGQRRAAVLDTFSRPESSAYRRLPQSPAQRIRRHSERAPDRSRDRYAQKSFRQRGGRSGFEARLAAGAPRAWMRSATANYLLKAEIRVMHFPFAGLRLSLIWSHESGALRAFDAKSETAEKFCLNRP